MEFKFNINNLFGNEICLIDKDLTPFRTSPLNIREYRAQLCQVIDRMGEASAKAQGLHGAITTAHRLQLTDHHLYIMKDGSANGGKGAIVGFIKTGRKRLFIYDHNGVNHEMEPLCTLDFYVHESRQRMGCGRKLFEFMLKAEGVQPHQLAIDRPSHKFLAFLNKHYKLRTTVPQVNNFVVFESFFRSVGNNGDKHKAGPHKPPIHPYRKLNGREPNDEGLVSRLSSGSSRPTSGGILPLSREKEALSNIPLQRQNSTENGRVADRHQNAGQISSVASLAMGAQGANYSRHGSTPSTPSSRGGHRGNGLPPSQNNGSSNGADDVALDVSKKIIGGRDPPLRHRDGPSEDYRKLFNNDSYQDHHGHLRVAPLGEAEVNNYKRNGFSYQKSKSSPTVVMTTSNNSLSDDNSFANNALKSQTMGSGWNVFGIPPNPRSVSYAKYHQTKLW